ncbi:putative mitochondrial protein [Vitis vinifera]|uniref:Putative mitochondrial protein n=1 Tax=Vitis vinifera TaxID=29760 RepID=A0A438FU74_VITVI|nr:putative mitochondrial protein [Vitis vinifera]
MKVLYKMGFGARWMEWIWWCISTAKFSVLVNGVPAGYFSNSRGPRQGDPLSPYLFVLGMEVLSVLLRRVVDGGFILGCSLRGRRGIEMNVSHLLFADDTIIFYEARQDHLTLSKLDFGVGVEWGLFLLFYLGLPLGANHKALSMWDRVEERMEEGIQKIDLLNKALLGKWIWRFALEKEILWKKVIGVKYGYEGFGWRTNEARGTFGVGLFALAVQRNATVNEMWDSSLGQGGWNIRLSRYSNDWELEAIRELFHMLRDLRISSEEDLVIWKGEGHSSFRIRDAYKLLAAPSAITFPKMSIWVDKVPTKVVFFGWKATWEKILTLDRLQR